MKRQFFLATVLTTGSLAFAMEKNINFAPIATVMVAKEISKELQKEQAEKKPMVEITPSMDIVNNKRKMSEIPSSGHLPNSLHRYSPPQARRDAFPYPIYSGLIGGSDLGL